MRSGRSVLLLTALMLAANGCKKTEPPVPSQAETKQPAPSRPKIGLNFVYGSEKKAWLKDALATFNAEQARGQGEVIIEVTGVEMGSGSAVTEIVVGTARPDVWSPASDLFRPLLNEAWTQAKGATGGGREIAPAGKPLVLSPLVIAMWKPMAQALGWPDAPVGWSDILALSTDPQGWASKGHPEWGTFKLAHTHPEYSNSGLMSVLAEIFAATGLKRGLTVEHVLDPQTHAYLESIEGSLVHYGKSTGFFADKMLTRGPSYLSAAVLYENLVIDAYRRPEFANRELDVVAVYPKEGTFWIDNPFIILDAPWADPQKKKAAETLQAYLLSEPVQRRAMSEFGFRPSDPAVAMAAPIDAAHGVDPQQPKTLLETPGPAVLRAALAQWKRSKKAVDLMFVFDRSGSMKGEPLRAAKQGASDFLDLLDDRDRVSVVVFNHEVAADIPEPTELRTGRKALQESVGNTFAEGGTALYDAVAAAHGVLARLAEKNPKRIYAVVALTDGNDEHSKMTEAQLEALLRPSSEMGQSVRVFTIAYGQGASATVLGKIADAGAGALFKGDAGNIRALYRDLAAFF